MSVRPLTPPAQSSGPLSGLSRFIGGFRWAFMPLGLLALIAVGVHAAADTLDERLLSLVDMLDAAFDRLVGASTLTEGWVDLISLEERTQIARGLALAWELSVDLVLALPALGYRESKRTEEEPWRKYLAQDTRPTWRPLFERFCRSPPRCAGRGRSPREAWSSPERARWPGSSRARCTSRGAGCWGRARRTRRREAWRSGRWWGFSRRSGGARCCATCSTRTPSPRRTFAARGRPSRMGSWARRWRCPWRSPRRWMRLPSSPSWR